MGAQDLQITLTGKDLSASESFRALSRVAAFAARNIEGSMERVDRKINQTARSSSESITQQFGSRLTGWAQSGLAGIMGGIAASTTSAVMNVVGDAGQAILSQLKTSVIDYNSTLENASIGFTTMLGSGEKASKFLNQLQDFGLKTPFQTDQLIQLSQQMMGYGVAAKNVIPYLTALGDASAAAGRTDALPNAVLAFEQMSARGRVDLADMNQLTAAGVPALKILAAAYGTTTGGILKMIHSGDLMSSQALPALITGIEKGTSKTAALGGMMEKQSHTFQGAMSNIKDAANKTLGAAFLPLFKGLERGAIAVQKFATSKQFTKWANDTGKVVGDVMGKIGSALQSVFADPDVQGALGKLGATLSDVFGKIGPAFDQILPDLVRFGQDVLPAIIGAIGDFAAKIPTLLKWWERLAGALADAGPTIANIVGFLSDLGGTLFNVSAAIGNFALTMVQGFTGFINDSAQRLQDFTANLTGIGAGFVTAIVNGILGQGNPIAQALTGLVASAANAVQGMIGGLTANVRALQQSANSNSDINSAKSALSAGQGAARAAAVARVGAFKMPNLAPIISGGVGGGGGGGGGGSKSKRKSLADIFADFRDYGREVGKGIQSGLLGKVSDISSAAKKIRDAIKDAFDAKYISKGTELAALRAVSTMTTRLKALSKEREGVLDRLKNLRNDRSSMVKSTRDSTNAAGDVTGFAAPGDAIQGLQVMVMNAKKFKGDLQKLVKKGIGGGMLSQLVSGWQSDPANALRTAEQLIANPTDLRQIISLQKQLGSAASSLGTYAGDAEYGSQIANSSAKAKVLSWKMQDVARSGMNRVSKETHIHVHVNGVYAGTKASLAKDVTQLIRDEIKKGAISKDWNKG